MIRHPAVGELTVAYETLTLGSAPDMRIVTCLAAPGPWRTCSTSRFPGTARRTKPSWYIVANNDRTVHPDLERSAAERMGANIRPVDSSQSHALAS
ncbi:hypothetical protein [Streptomyces sp. NPDC004065]|uniref:hypothetical protein n=1 Tax=Streptomyces sp. NPDC004065 TaxID=3364689 RepID=UPI00384A748D